MSRGNILKRVGKNGDVSWRLKWELPRAGDGKRQYGYKTIRGNKKQAQTALTEILSQQDNGTYVPPTDLSVAEWAETWLRDYARGRARKTYERWAELLRLHVVPRIGSKKLQHVRGSDFDRIYSEMQRPEPADGKPVRALSARTALHVHRTLFLMFGAAEKKRHIQRNPVRDADAPTPTTKAPVVLTEPRLSALLSAIQTEEAAPGYFLVHEWHMYPFAIFAAGTGMRLGELLALRRCDLDLAPVLMDGEASAPAGRVLVARSVEETKEFGLQIKPPKSGKSRSLPIPQHLVTVARQLMAQQDVYWIQHDIKLEDKQAALLFPATWKTPLAPGRPVLVSQRFAIRANRYGFTGFTCHGLRHTHASLLLRRGINVKVVSERLGHSTVAITMQIYAHFMPDMQAHAAQVAGSILDAGTNGVHGGVVVPFVQEAARAQMLAAPVKSETRRVGRAVECGGLEIR